jgi:predicted Zn-dependent protease
LTLVAGVLVLGGAWVLLSERDAAGGPSLPCAELGDSLCTSPADDDAGAAASLEVGASSAPTLSSAEACINVGYLCSDLAGTDRIRLQRWKDFSGTIVVHVPRPDFEESADALALQQAAAVGLRAWNGQPFQIMIDTRGDRSPHFAVRWTRSLGGRQIGVARTQWSSASGLRVVSIELTTRTPFDPSRLVDLRQVRLTAAHEMGHALGLPHSDSPRDVMYPTNSATSLSAQDYRTMESLYRLPDGTEVVR